MRVSGDIQAEQDQPTSRPELALVLGALLFGGYVRVTSLHFLSHFDEGIYAISGLWPWTGSFESFQGFYSPPVYPFLIGVVNSVLGGTNDLSGAVVSLLAGIGLILGVWRIGRRWWTPLAGVLAAWLVAADGVQVAYSTVGLTDATFTFFFLMSLYAIHGALRTASWRGLVIAGILVGFTWNIKYNGFLPLLIGVGFLRRTEVLQGIGRLGLMGAIAALGYLPWALHIHSQFGYQRLIEHQRGYLAGWQAIPSNLAIALRDWTILEAFPWFPVPILPLSLLALAAFGVYAPSPLSRWGRLWIAAWMLLLPAIYTPYFRLWLPTVALILLFAAGGFAAIYQSTSNVALRWLAIIILIPGLLWMGWKRLDSHRTLGYAAAADQLADWAQQHQRRLVLLTRPPLRYYLAIAESPVYFRTVDRVQADDLSPDEVLVVDALLKDNPALRSQIDALPEQQRQQLETFHVEPHDVTRLDDLPRDYFITREGHVDHGKFGRFTKYELQVLGQSPPVENPDEKLDD